VRKKKGPVFLKKQSHTHTHELWRPRSPDMNPGDHYSCKTLKNSVLENSSFTARTFWNIEDNFPYFQDRSSI